MVQHLERSFAGRPFRLEAGRLAKQAAGSALLQFGETVVLAAVTVSDVRSPLPFFPLTVEYREKTYAAGKIPGGFLKREGRPSDDEREIIKATSVRKMEWKKAETPADLVARVHELAEARVAEGLNLPEKSERAQALAALRATVIEQLTEEFPDNVRDVSNVIEDI